MEQIVDQRPVEGPYAHEPHVLKHERRYQRLRMAEKLVERLLEKPGRIFTVSYDEATADGNDYHQYGGPGVVLQGRIRLKPVEIMDVTMSRLTVPYMTVSDIRPASTPMLIRELQIRVKRSARQRFNRIRRPFEQFVAMPAVVRPVELARHLVSEYRKGPYW